MEHLSWESDSKREYRYVLARKGFVVDFHNSTNFKIFKIKNFPMYLTMFAVMLAAVVGYTDCHLSNSEQTTKQMSIELINPKPLHGINALAMPCIEPYDANFCLNGGRCFNVTVASYSIPSCECAPGFLGERCEQKYLSRSYNPENYMQADDIINSRNRNNVDNPRSKHNSINIFVTAEIFVGSSAVDKVSATVILLLAMLLLHFLIFIVAV